MKIIVVNPPQLRQFRNLTRATKVRGAHDTLYCSGTTPADDRCPLHLGDFAAQSAQVKADCGLVPDASGARWATSYNPA